jgi:hypothetical protein
MVLVCFRRRLWNSTLGYDWIARCSPATQKVTFCTCGKSLQKSLRSFGHKLGIVNWVVAKAAYSRGLFIGAGRGSRTPKTRSSADFEFPWACGPPIGMKV